MARLFPSLADADALSTRNRQSWRDQRGLGEAVDLIDQSVHHVQESRPLEKDIQRQVRDALRLHPAVSFVFRVNSGAYTTHDGYADRYIRYHDIPGMSDLWLWLKQPYAPRQAFIECKRPGQRPTVKQSDFLEAVVAFGHVGFVTTSAAAAFERLTLELSR